MFEQVMYIIFYVLSLLLGIFVGFILAINGITKRIMNKINAKTDEKYEVINPEIKEQINAKIADSYEYYKKLQDIRNKNNKAIFAKKKDLKIEKVCDFKWLIYEVAKIFYPESSNPLLELNINELLELVKRISLRLDESLEATGLASARYMKLSAVYMTLDVFNKINNVRNNKIMQLVLRFVNFSILVTNIFNPASWLKRTARNKITNDLTSFVIEDTCKIVGKETACIYNKNIVKASLDNEILAIAPMPEIESTKIS